MSPFEMGIYFEAIYIKNIYSITPTIIYNIKLNNNICQIGIGVLNTNLET
jgi:hypothetical protein